MVHVVATIELKPGAREAFLTEFGALVPQVRAERGCIEYGPAVDVASGLGAQPPLRANAVVVIEKWADLDALRAHMNAPHMADYRTKVAPLLEGLTLHVMQPA
jgi:quinol monooxygenase YgiN